MACHRLTGPGSVQCKDLRRPCRNAQGLSTNVEAVHRYSKGYSSRPCWVQTSRVTTEVLPEESCCPSTWPISTELVSAHVGLHDCTEQPHDFPTDPLFDNQCQRLSHALQFCSSGIFRELRHRKLLKSKFEDDGLFPEDVSGVKSHFRRRLASGFRGDLNWEPAQKSAVAKLLLAHEHDALFAQLGFLLSQEPAQSHQKLFPAKPGKCNEDILKDSQFRNSGRAFLAQIASVSQSMNQPSASAKTLSARRRRLAHKLYRHPVHSFSSSTDLELHKVLLKLSSYLASCSEGFFDDLQERMKLGPNLFEARGYPAALKESASLKDAILLGLQRKMYSWSDQDAAAVVQVLHAEAHPQMFAQIGYQLVGSPNSATFNVFPDDPQDTHPAVSASRDTPRYINAGRALVHSATRFKPLQTATLPRTQARAWGVVALWPSYSRHSSTSAPPADHRSAEFERMGRCIALCSGGIFHGVREFAQDWERRSELPQDLVLAPGMRKGLSLGLSGLYGDPAWSLDEKRAVADLLLSFGCQELFAQLGFLLQAFKEDSGSIVIKHTQGSKELKRFAHKPSKVHKEVYANESYREIGHSRLMGLTR